MTTRRPLWIVTTLLLAAAALLWGASRLPWGTETPAAPVPLALLALAAIAGVLATSGWARPVVGVLVALAGLAAGWTAFDGGLAHGVGARVLALVGALVLVGAGVVLVRSGQRMPRLGGSYQTPAAARGNEPPDKELWRALSEGKDPTVE
ncbi:Trp biosynthesis-associated membrane protein [Kibdelosporangium lantanae]